MLGMTAMLGLAMGTSEEKLDAKAYPGCCPGRADLNTLPLLALSLRRLLDKP
jgi:hypothetical protein